MTDSFEQRMLDEARAGDIHARLVYECYIRHWVAIMKDPERGYYLEFRVMGTPVNGIHEETIEGAFERLAGEEINPDYGKWYA